MVLTRKTGEKIVIGGNVEVVVVRTRRGDVKLGILAPRSVRVRRAELPETPTSKQGGEKRACA